MADNAAIDANRTRSLIGVDSIIFTAPTTVAVNATTHAMLVEGTVTPSGTQDVNLVKVGGSSFALGQQLAASSLPVVLTAAQIVTLTPLSTVGVTQSTSPWVVSLTSTTVTGNVTVVQPTASNLNAQVAGDVASSATDSGNPVKVGAKYNLTQPFFTDGQRGDLQLDSRGNLRVIIGTSGTPITALVDNVDGAAVSSSANKLGVMSRNTVYNPTTTQWDRMYGDATGGQWVQGAIASGATDTGNPVKVGGKYNATKPTFADGQRGDNQLGTRGSLIVQLAANDSVTPLVIGADNVDAVATFATNNKLTVVARSTILNPAGTPSWDRQYAVVNATNTTGTGITAAGLLAQFDDASPTTITENQFGNLRMSIDRSLYVENHYVYGRATADTQIKSSAGFVHTINISPTGTVTAGVMTIYDNTAESGTVIYSVSLPITSFTPFTVVLDVVCATGIYVGWDATLANVQATFSYR